VSAIQTSLDNVNQALADLGSDQKKMEAHRTFVGKLTDSLTEGVGNLVDADMAKERAIAGLAGQTAAGRSGALHRQHRTANHPVAVRLTKPRATQSY
jgi:hypothetical protein